MMVADQNPSREAREESKEEGQEETGAEVRGEELEEEENGQSPSHLPFAPSSQLPDTTTVDPSYIISLIRKLLPNNIRAQKQCQNATYNLYPVETLKECPVEENMVGESNYMKKVADAEANNNSVLHNIVNDSEGSANDHFVDWTYSSASTYNGMGPDSRNQDTGSDDNAWEDSGCIIWDLSASRTHAEFMVNNFMLEVLLASLHSSKSPRITEICLGILGNLACHDVSSKAMATKDGLIEMVISQLYLDDSPCLSETFRLLTVALHGTGSTLWAKALLSEQTCLRIIWIVGNT
ncbi:hypothetical protein KFK09_021374 [Dendrobium nobile]|uniref:Uncharacterized protein n=1 Tax=Dendrobium nobile TaxID=94219 RepID=A0A8T3AP54_DENNO|nr:hypothetical protein KFK09_021374 [Dendrobium nobile]